MYVNTLKEAVLQTLLLTNSPTNIKDPKTTQRMNKQISLSKINTNKNLSGSNYY